MFISKYGKTYDDADGSEQCTEGRTGLRSGAQRGGEIGRERWADDGGPANDAPARPLAPRPPWSVLSAHDLDAAIRRELRADDPERLQLEAERAERRAAESRARAGDRAAAAARARADRYQNAWENA